MRLSTRSIGRLHSTEEASNNKSTRFSSPSGMAAPAKPSFVQIDAL
jgi:hypothetical protein